MKSYDVALVKLDCVVETTEKIKLVKLAKFNDALLRTRADEPVVVTGFGRQNRRANCSCIFLGIIADKLAPLSKTLREVNLTTVDVVTCADRLKDTNIPIDTTMMSLQRMSGGFLI
jgi:hypothetical protein